MISLNVPLTKKIKNLFGTKYLNRMKKNSILVNTSRGGMVNEEALYKILKKSKKIKAYFDVLLVEPPKNNKLFKLDNFFISSHIGGTTKETIELGGRLCIESFFKKNN